MTTKIENRNTAIFKTLSKIKSKVGEMNDLRIMDIFYKYLRTQNDKQNQEKIDDFIKEYIINMKFNGLSKESDGSSYISFEDFVKEWKNEVADKIAKDNNDQSIESLLKVLNDNYLVMVTYNLGKDLDFLKGNIKCYAIDKEYLDPDNINSMQMELIQSQKRNSSEVRESLVELAIEPVKKAYEDGLINNVKMEINGGTEVLITEYMKKNKNDYDSFFGTIIRWTGDIDDMFCTIYVPDTNDTKTSKDE